MSLYHNRIGSALALKTLGYPPFSLRDDEALRRELLAAMDDRGVSISLGEGLLIAPGVDVRSYAADLDIMAELRIPRINTVSLEPDRARTFDELAALTALGRRTRYFDLHRTRSRT